MTDLFGDSASPALALARKWRPRAFADLKGQEHVVQALSNALTQGRLHHAYLLTGTRGVGKTTLARILAKCLNCETGVTNTPCGVCSSCTQIDAGRFVDLLELDAASNTGVDNMREVLDNAQYAPTVGRYKVYIIDEVHMLSKNAFNALLKTLEEPPEHVKFLFATTEVNKVPITVLSRCQRFDLRRIPAEKLAAHFTHVTQAEGVRAEPAALALIAQAAEGSARDGLSILDQAIAHADLEQGEALVTASQVRDMLGLSDRGSVRRLLGLLLAGDGAPMLEAVREQHDLGVEPLALMRGLLEIVHAITVAKAGRGSDDPAHSAEERDALAEWAAALSLASLHRLWQLLLKGHDEVASAILPLEACEMALLRAVYAGTMPDPAELARLLRDGGGMTAVAAGAGGEPTVGVTAPQARSAIPQAAQAGDIPESFAALVERIAKSGAALLANTLHDEVGLVRYAPPELVIATRRPIDMKDLVTRLNAITGAAWQVSIDDGPGEPTLWEQERANEEAARQAILSTPIVGAAIAAFPQAELLPQDDTQEWSASA